MPPRAFGSETEYTHDKELLSVIHKSQASHGKNKLSLFDFVDPDIALSRGRTEGTSVVITTGAELYIDLGMLEYATPECRTPHELLLHERAGEQIVTDTYQRLADHTENSEVSVYKRSGYANVVHDGMTLIREDSVGNHENYTSLNPFGVGEYNDRATMLNQSVAAHCFADFLALRKLIDGIGMVNSENYSITQKPAAIDFRNFDHMTGHGIKRPFFQNASRLEVRSGEGNKSDWAKEFIIGLTSLVIRLIEHEKYPKEMLLANPNQALYAISRNPLANVWLESGDKMKGIDVLKNIVNAAVEIGIASPDFPAYEQKAANDFYTFYDDLHKIDLKKGDVKALSDRIDWAARYEYMIEKGATYDTFTSWDLDQVRHDLKWDKLGNKDIARRRFRRFGHTALQVPIPEPPRTRALARVNIIKELREAGSLRSVTWHEVGSAEGTYRLQGSLDHQTTTFTPKRRTITGKS